MKKEKVLGIVMMVLFSFNSVSFAFNNGSWNAVSNVTGATPFFVNQSNPELCGYLLMGESCSKTWSYVNATGEAGSYIFAVVFSSNNGNVADSGLDSNITVIIFSKGTIPVSKTAGHPFFIQQGVIGDYSSDNPNSTFATNMKAGDSKTIKWKVNATDETLSAWELYVKFDSDNPNVNSNNTVSKTITVAEQEENNVPTVDLVSVSPSPITPTCGLNSTMTVNATISDLDGYEDITSVIAKIFNTTQSLETPNYQLTLIQLSCDGNTCSYGNSHGLYYWDEASSNWNVTIIADDSEAESGDNSTLFEIEEQVCLNITNVPLTYGTAYPSQTVDAQVGNGFPLDSQNLGNVNMDTVISGTLLSGNPDETWNIPVNNTEYDDNSDFSSSTDLSGTPTSLGLTILPTTDDSTYFRITIPPVIKAQGYQGNLTITASKS